MPAHLAVAVLGVLHQGGDAIDPPRNELLILGRIALGVLVGAVLVALAWTAWRRTRPGGRRPAP